MERKSYVDIENLRESDIMLNGEITRRNNIGGFKKGDIISVTTKLDGSNGAISFDTIDNQLHVFSRKQELDFKNTLNGFWNWAMTLNIEAFKSIPNYIVYGEWMGNSKRQNKITYDRQFGWVVYSIWDKETQHWLEQDIVKDFCNRNGFEYIEELYYGPYIDIDHCKSFLHSSKYGPVQEGIVIRNITEILRNKEVVEEGSLNYINSHHKFILKIVNSDFKESMVKAPKVIDPAKEEARKKAEELMGQVVTQNRVEKILGKLQMENELPTPIEPKMMGEVAKKLNKAVYEDVVKEEPEVLQACGEYGGKICSSLTMAIARRIILGE